jgi:hypothetical protein
VTKIIGFGHFKQSGKSTSCEFLRQEILGMKELCQLPDFAVGEPLLNSPMQEFCKYNEAKIYSFADKLKEFCVDVLGLTKKQCYGSDDDKNSLTHMKWEDMPGVITPDQIESFSRFETSGGWFLINEDFEDLGLIIHERRSMTAREVLQYFGTGICRKMYPNVWVDATIRQIQKDNWDFALIADCRFRNEAEAIQKVGGKVIGFTRRPFPEDNHSSEVDLIGYPFDALIDNRDMSVDKKNEIVLNTIKEWGWL